MRAKQFFFSLSVLGIIFPLVLLGPAICPHDPSHIALELKNTPPGKLFWFGSDDLGRDVFSRTIFGGRISLLIAVFATLIKSGLGVLWASMAVYREGKTGKILLRICDILQSIPHLLVAMLCTFIWRPGVMTVLIAISLTGWTGIARIVRTQLLQVKKEEYVLAAVTLGASPSRILMHHLLPNAKGPIIASILLSVPSALFTEAFLSFLGLGIQAPNASWGVLLNDAMHNSGFYPWRLFFPAAMLSLTIFSFNLLGRSLKRTHLA